jgi:hypothetical protein
LTSFVLANVEITENQDPDDESIAAHLVASGYRENEQDDSTVDKNATDDAGDSTASTQVPDDDSTGIVQEDFGMVQDDFTERDLEQIFKGVFVSSAAACSRSSSSSKLQVKQARNLAESNIAEELETAKIMRMLDAANSPLLKALNEPQTIGACLSRSVSHKGTIPQECLAKSLVMGSGLGLDSKKPRTDEFKKAEATESPYARATRTVLTDISTYTRK